MEAAKPCEGSAAVRIQLGLHLNFIVKILRVTTLVQQAIFILKVVAVRRVIQRPGILSAAAESYITDDQIVKGHLCRRAATPPFRGAKVIRRRVLQ